MEEEQEIIARLQRDAANDVILKNYSYLVGCINAILILPYLVESRLVNQDFRQRLEGERTDTDKMMALLRELTRSPMEGWFKEFIGALSKVSQYNTVVGNLLKDFTDIMEKKLTLPPPEDDDRRGPPQANAAVIEPVSPLVVNVSGVDEVMKKAMDDAQAGHKEALAELEKARSHLLGAEKAKAYAEAEKQILEERVSEFKKKMREANKRLKEVEMQKRLFEKEIESYKDKSLEIQQRTCIETMQLNEAIDRLQSEKEAARERLQNVEGEREALGTRVASLEAEVISNMKEREEEVTALQQQLGDVKTQQQMAEDEMKRLWKEMREKQQSLESATRQLDKLQSTREEEMAHLQGQLEMSASRMEVLKGELADAREVKVRLTKDISALREELEKKSVECAEAKVVQQKAEEMEKIVQWQRESIHELKIAKVKYFTEANELRVQLEEVKESMVVMSTSQKDVEMLTKQLEVSKSEVAHLAAEVDDLSSAHETVAWELTQHKEAGKEKDLCIAELEDVLQQVTKEHSKLALRESDLINQLELEREKYALKATEAIDLNRHLKEVQDSLLAANARQTEVEVLLNAAESEVARLAAEVDDLSSAQELAMQKLTQCKEEGKEKDLCIAELEDALQQVTEEHRRMEAEIMLIEERTDRKIHDKNGQITALKERLAELEEELDQERKEVVNLRERLRLRQENHDVQQRQQELPRRPRALYVQPYTPPPIRYPAQGYPHAQGPAPAPGQPFTPPAAHVPAPTPAPRANEGECPICHKIFPSRRLQKHVNGHFED